VFLGVCKTQLNLRAANRICACPKSLIGRQKTPLDAWKFNVFRGRLIRELQHKEAQSGTYPSSKNLPHVDLTLDPIAITGSIAIQ
jgi:hypothetical protein